MGVISNGTTLLDSGSLSSGLTGALTLISTTTASSDANVSITSGINSTYKEYIITYTNVHPATDNQDFTVNFRDGSTAYDATKTTTFFTAHHGEDDSPATLQYSLGGDLAQSTGVQNLAYSITNDNDGSVSGTLHLFDPSSTTFIKHFIANSHAMVDDGGVQNTNFFVAGYCNVTAAIDGVQFKFDSGNIDTGTFKLYGVS
tara:strand:- start:242 stop:844 length:603 start_codon:yes stop_codon:yes gene_type:complete